MLLLNGYFTITQTADKLGVVRQFVHRLIQKGRLQAVRIGNQYLIHEDDLKAYKPRKVGRPRKGEPGVKMKTGAPRGRRRGQNSQ